MKRILLPFILFSLALSIPALAHCPLCTAATGATVMVTRMYGIDDLAVGTFIGGFVLSTSFWFDRVLKKRNKGSAYVPMQTIALVILGVVFTILTFALANLTGPTNPTVFGINRLILGTVIGTIVAFSAFEFHKLLKGKFRKNLIPFQGIVLTLLSLALVSLGFYLVGWV